MRSQINQVWVRICSYSRASILTVETRLLHQACSFLWAHRSMILEGWESVLKSLNCVLTWILVQAWSLFLPWVFTPKAFSKWVFSQQYSFQSSASLLPVWTWRFVTFKWIIFIESFTQYVLPVSEGSRSLILW